MTNILDQLLKEINDRNEIIRKQAEQIGALKAELSLKAKTASPAHDLPSSADNMKKTTPSLKIIRLT